MVLKQYPHFLPFFKFRGGVQKRSQKRIPLMYNFWWKIHFWLRQLCWNWTELNITVKLDYSIWYGLAFPLLTSVWWFGSTSYWHESHWIYELFYGEAFVSISSDNDISLLGTPPRKKDVFFSIWWTAMPQS